MGSIESFSRHMMNQLMESFSHSERSVLNSNTLLKDRFTPKIVVIDDSLEMLNLIKSFIQIEQIGEAKVFNNEFEALSWVSRNDVDLVIVDIHLTSVDGYKIGDIIRSITKNETPVIYITADDKSIVDFYKLEQRNSYFMNKPFNKKVFQKVVSSMLFMEVG